MGLAIFSAILHNIFSVIFDVEEPVFFTLTILMFLSFILAVIYNVFTYFFKGQPRDIWQLGWLGLFGLLGLITPGFYGFYGFFGFFGLKKK
jgi:hypothetical protein